MNALEALATLIRKGRAIQIRKLGACGKCPYYSFYKAGCSLTLGCVLTTGSTPRHGSFPWSNLHEPVLKQVRTVGKALPMDPLHLKDDEKPKNKAQNPIAPSAFQRDVAYKDWSQRFPEPLSEDRKTLLWNWHMVQKERDFAALMEEDKFRRMVEEVLTAFGIEWSDTEVDEADEVESEDEVEEAVKTLTKAVKENNKWQSTRQTS